MPRIPLLRPIIYQHRLLHVSIRAIHNKVKNNTHSFKGIYFHGSPKEFKLDERLVFIHQDPNVSLSYAQKDGGKGILYQVTPINPTYAERNVFGHLQVQQDEWKFEKIDKSDIPNILENYKKKSFDSTNLLPLVPLGIVCILGKFAEAVSNHIN